MKQFDLTLLMYKKVFVFFKRGWGGDGGWEAHKQVTDINPVVLVNHWTDQNQCHKVN